MKKLITSILAAALLCSMSVTAFAVSPIETADGSDSASVKGSYQASTTAGTVYCVDIAWGEMKFTYKAASKGNWDAVNHAYTDETAAVWTATGNTVTVTNHSNTAIEATLSYAASTGYTGITGNFEGTIGINKLEIVSAVGTDKTEAPRQIASLTLAGELASNTEANTIIGTVTVSLTDESSEDSLQS